MKTDLLLVSVKKNTWEAHLDKIIKSQYWGRKTAMRFKKKNYIQSYLSQPNCHACLWNMGGSRCSWRKFKQARGEHAKFPKEDQSWDQNPESHSNLAHALTTKITLHPPSFKHSINRIRCKTYKSKSTSQGFGSIEIFLYFHPRKPWWKITLTEQQFTILTFS